VSLIESIDADPASLRLRRIRGKTQDRRATGQLGKRQGDVLETFKKVKSTFGDEIIYVTMFFDSVLIFGW
jgi:hypothetical protein